MLQKSDIFSRVQQLNEEMQRNLTILQLKF
jgi:hypothetical protein